MPDVVVVGGGIAGLSAARDLALAGRDVLLLEASRDLGGKLRTGSVAGLSVDVGAEAMLNRRPEGVGLAAEMGLDVVHPTSATSRILSRGALRPMPRSLMGLPFDVDEVERSGILSPEGLARLRAETPGAPVAGDASVGDLLAERLGAEVVQRLTEPLLGGVYAGHAHEISARAALPPLLAMAARGPLLPQAAALPTSDVPVFAGLVGGMGTWPARFTDTAGLVCRTGATVRALRPAAGRWSLTVGPTTHEETIVADHVVLASPAAATARLLGEVAPGAARALSAIEAASVAVVTFAYDRRALPEEASSMSGFLVPPIEPSAIKAATYSFAKWAWVGGLDPDVRVLRTSLGRHRDVASLQVSDDELVARSRAELARIAGIEQAPLDAHVQRWGGGLPQYAVGHVERIARARAELPPGVVVCGASMDGVGIPAVIGSARRAAAGVLSAQ